MKKQILVILFIILSSGGAKADMTLSLYEELRSSNDPETKAILQLFLEATFTGIQTTVIRYEADGYPMAFCPPEEKIFTIDELYGFLDSEVAAAKAIRGVPYLGDEPVSFVMLNALQTLFPCESYRRKN
ncbi:MAG: hypothetical protein RH942_01355 [Kiloniellaceae bacterium]